MRYDQSPRDTLATSDAGESDDIAPWLCTACDGPLPEPSEAVEHTLLNVPLCVDCAAAYDAAEFVIEPDGSDSLCRCVLFRALAVLSSASPLVSVFEGRGLIVARLLQASLHLRNQLGGTMLTPRVLHQLCRWCGGARGCDVLMCCERCPRAFCEECLEQNLAPDDMKRARAEGMKRDGLVFAHPPHAWNMLRMKGAARCDSMKERTCGRPMPM